MTPAEKTPPLNFVFILVDTLRADHLGCYDYSRDTSPYIDRLAKESVLYERAVTNSSFTGQAVTSLFMGTPPSMRPNGWGLGSKP